jgi:hypothetical protein
MVGMKRVTEATKGLLSPSFGMNRVEGITLLVSQPQPDNITERDTLWHSGKVVPSGPRKSERNSGPVRNLVSGAGKGYNPQPAPLTEIYAWKRN